MSITIERQGSPSITVDVPVQRGFAVLDTVVAGPASAVIAVEIDRALSLLDRDRSNNRVVPKQPLRN